MTIKLRSLTELEQQTGVQPSQTIQRIKLRSLTEPIQQNVQTTNYTPSPVASNIGASVLAGPSTTLADPETAKVASLGLTKAGAFSSGLIKAIPSLGEIGRPTITPTDLELKKKQFQSELIAKRDQPGFYSGGKTVGSLAKYGAAYSALGPLVETAASPLVSKLPSFVQPFTTELAKDIAIGTPLAFGEEVSEGKRGTELVKAMGLNSAIDVVTNIAFLKAGKLIKGLKKADVAQEVAKSINVDKTVKEIADDVVLKLSQPTSFADQATDLAAKGLDLTEQGLKQVDRTPAIKSIQQLDIERAAKETASIPEVSPVKQRTVFIKTISDSIGITKYEDSKEFSKIVDEVIAEIKTDKSVSRGTSDKLFKEITDRGIVSDNEFYDLYKPLKAEIKKARLYIGDSVKSDFSPGEYNNFKKANFGNLSLTNDKNAMNVDSFYQELNASNPELFPDGVTALRDQLERIADVQQSIVKSETSLSSFVNSDAEFKRFAEEEFYGAIRQMEIDINKSSDISSVLKQVTPSQQTQTQKQFLPTISDADLGKNNGLGPLIKAETADVLAEESARKLSKVASESANIKDIGVTARWTTDVFRNFEKAFGDNFDVVKKALLDPFDAAKKARVEDEIALTDELKSYIVDQLGIGKDTKLSKLVQRFGEKRMTLDELKLEAPKDWENVVTADGWFRQKYNNLINEINAPLIAQGKTPVPTRENYYRHFLEMGDTFSGIKNIFETSQLISPKLEGLSEFTKPGTKWASFKQKRGLGEFKEDAVGGFLEYIKAGTYAKHIDPEIPKFRAFKRAIDEANPTGSAGVNHFSEFLDEWTNGIAGKTGFLDRSFQKLIGRKGTAIINALNSRMKSNAVLGNASSALSQIANVPQAIAHVKNPTQLAGGLDGYFKSLVGGGDSILYNQSGFLKERLTDSFSQFDTKIIDQPKKLAQWMLGALDETGTKFIWSAEYRKALAEGIENPIKYADDLTRKMVAGRGIGEVPELQRQKLFQLVAPFTLEVGNLWKVQKEFLDKKDFAALAILYAANFGLNEVLENVRGSRVVFDPIDAIKTGLEETEGEGFTDKLATVSGNLAGETLGNIPLGQAAAQLFPEYSKTTGIQIPEKIQPLVPNIAKTDDGALKIPSRADLFGETDPTRFGTELPLVRALSKPISSLVTPFGGQQIRKTKEGAESLGILPRLTDDGLTKEAIARNKSGKVQAVVTPTVSSTAKGLLFGKGAIPEIKEYYESDRGVLGEKQTEKFDNLIKTGKYDTKELFDAILEAKKFTTKAERTKALRKTYSGTESRDILIDFFGYSFK